MAQGRYNTHGRHGRSDNDEGGICRALREWHVDSWLGAPEVAISNILCYAHNFERLRRISMLPRIDSSQNRDMAPDGAGGRAVTACNGLADDCNRRRALIVVAGELASLYQVRSDGLEKVRSNDSEC